ncbi:Chymotrypsin-like proteinase 6D [Operophtera brumata]|uniref:Chymotrypsin-like proteinase 6D n=1 Tax=Operophtera brumata TaxID=104452 RepID=A0A0L7LUS5_OPEBR|nr:Chymotrypsin-like proteinase 6D [Operophtera brumata]
MGSWLSNWLTMEAVVGTNDLENKESTAQTVKILERIPHPNYDGGIGTYDIAMLKTAKNIKYNNAVSPIEVPLSMGSLTHKTQNLILAGWGVLETTLFIPALPDKLQEAQVEYLPFDECKKAIDAVKESYEDNPLDKVGNICTGPITGGVAACSGDSGGPLIQYISYNNEDATTVSTQLITEDIEYETTAFDENNVGNEKLNGNIKTRANKDKSSATTNMVSVVGLVVQNYRDDGLIPVVIGVVSWGISPCGEVGAPTVYTNEFDEDNPLNRVDHICTGPITGGEKACSGDSGGPLIQYILYNNEGLTTTTQLTTEDIEYETTASNDHMAHIGSEEFNDNTRARKKKHKSSRTKKTVSKVAGIVQKYKDNGLIPVVIGVVSWGISACGEEGAPTVYTNVSNHVDFINKHIYN